MANQLRLLSGATALQTEAIDLQQEAGEWASAFNTFQQVGKVAESIVQTEEARQKKVNNLVDAHTARQDAAIFNQEISNQNGTDRRVSYEGKLSEITNKFQEGSISSGYYQSFMGAIEDKYAVALGDQQTEYNNSVGQAAGSEYMAGIKAGIAGDATTYINNQAELTGVPPAVIRDGVLTGVYDDYNNRMGNASTIEELNALDKEFNGVKSTSFNSTQLLKTRSKELSAKIKQLESTISNTKEAKEKQFKYESKEFIDDAVANEFTNTPEEMEKHFDIAYEDPVTNGTKKRDYKKSHIEQNTIRDYVSRYSPDTPHPTVPEVAKDKWQGIVTDTASMHFLKGNTEGFIDTVSFNPDFSKEIGYSLNQAFIQAESTEQLDGIVSELYKISLAPRGATALRQSIGDDEFVNIISTSYIAKALYQGDVVKARDYVTQSDQNVEKQGLNKDLHADIIGYEQDLGPQYNRYKAVMTRINNINPKLAQDEYKNIAKFFASQVDKKGDIMVDMSMDASLEAKALDPDRVFNKVVSGFEKEAGIQPSRITYLSDGTAYLYDNFGGTASVINVDKITNKENETIKEESRIESRKRAERQKTGLGKIQNVLEDAPEIAIGAATDITEGFTDSIGRLVSRFTGYLGQQWDKDVDMMYKAIGLKSPTEKKALADALFEYEQSLVTDIAKPAFNTLDEVHTDTLRNVLLGNKKKKEIISSMREAVEDDSISDMLRAREGYEEVSYYDSEGHLTGGIGHLMTESEQKKYPKGTKIPEKVIQEWYDKDKAKAIKAAKEQSKELNNPKLVEALSHVNFQLGTKWNEEFKDTYNLIKEGDINNAISNLRNSLWYKQTPTRVEDFIKSLENKS